MALHQQRAAVAHGIKTHYHSVTGTFFGQKVWFVFDDSLFFFNHSRYQTFQEIHRLYICVIIISVIFLVLSILLFLIIFCICQCYISEWVSVYEGTSCFPEKPDMLTHDCFACAELSSQIIAKVPSIPASPVPAINTERADACTSWECAVFLWTKKTD